MAERVRTAEDLAPAIAAAAERYLDSDRDAALIDLEVYMASARDERLREAAREWTDSLHELIEPLAGAEAATSITALLDGYLTAAVISGTLDKGALERAIARLVG
ncbi:hypothetical protein HJD18_01685 [Thermoleophilia bacterium SCSIO 60948]|nr:hypothetical protein HJD18_01685 [Thermoleophilia bacterium SCSIO 60948]